AQGCERVTNRWDNSFFRRSSEDPDRIGDLFTLFLFQRIRAIIPASTRRSVLMLDQDLNRRDILKSLLGMTAALMLPEVTHGQTSQPAKTRDRYGDLLPLRKLGKTGAMVTMLGLGGSHVGRPSEAEAQKIIETAIAGGVRFFDCAVVYQKGDAE